MTPLREHGPQCAAEEKTIPAVSGQDVTTLVGYLPGDVLDKSSDPSALAVLPGTASTRTTLLQPANVRRRRTVPGQHRGPPKL